MILYLIRPRGGTEARLSYPFLGLSIVKVSSVTTELSESNDRKKIYLVSRAVKLYESNDLKESSSWCRVRS
jgi:hypothetical protein